jgi:deoxyribodipyrimidine photo-lyase
MRELAPGYVISLNSIPLKTGPVIYWMCRDQRIGDNASLLHAQNLALGTRSPLVILFCLAPLFPGETIRQLSFMLEGLKEIESRARQLGIGFLLRAGNPPEMVQTACEGLSAGALVTDFSPLRTPRLWIDQVSRKIRVSFFEVDSHNVVPCRTASPKQEYSARTLRPKIIRLLPDYLKECPAVRPHPFRMGQETPPVDWRQAEKGLQADRSVQGVAWLKPGEQAARAMLDQFIETRLHRYAAEKNDPTKEALSNLSPYLHFGQISATRVALEVRRRGGAGTEPFMEELIIRKELAENFCFYNPRYDEFTGLPSWGKAALEKHWSDPREYLYSQEQFEEASTLDPLWNAAQTQMVVTGKMHGYMRMYWAKKILEWSRDPEEAFAITLYLNDKYELDGRDPNGYAGIGWSIGGLHDLPWFDRPVFGTVRYMNAAGCKRKFNTEKYIEQWHPRK